MRLFKRLLHIRIEELFSDWDLTTNRTVLCWRVSAHQAGLLIDSCFLQIKPVVSQRVKLDMLSFVLTVSLSDPVVDTTDPVSTGCLDLHALPLSDPSVQLCCDAERAAL